MARATLKPEVAPGCRVLQVRSIVDDQRRHRIIAGRVVVFVAVYDQPGLPAVVHVQHPADPVDAFRVAVGNLVEEAAEALQRVGREVEFRQGFTDHQLRNGEFGDGLLVGVAYDKERVAVGVIGDRPFGIVDVGVAVILGGNPESALVGELPDSEKRQVADVLGCCRGAMGKQQENNHAPECVRGLMVHMSVFQLQYTVGLGAAAGCSRGLTGQSP